MSESRKFLSVETLITGYGKKQVLHGISLEVDSGEIVAIIGHNGAGKSTLLHALFGLLPIWRGSVHIEGKHVERLAPRELLRAGVALVPQGNNVFRNLTVGENLNVAGSIFAESSKLDAAVDRVLSLFPALRRRLRQRAGTLSGGEKQMLALGNALLLSPRLLFLDEPSVGLSPSLASEVLGYIQHISRDSGVAVLIVEQKVREVLKIAQRAYVLRNGLVSFAGSAESLNDAKLREVFI
jgi:branched-chain amino acid transport system ATP-binding protein